MSDRWRRIFASAADGDARSSTARNIFAVPADLKRAISSALRVLTVNRKVTMVPRSELERYDEYERVA